MEYTETTTSNEKRKEKYNTTYLNSESIFFSSSIKEMTKPSKTGEDLK